MDWMESDAPNECIRLRIAKKNPLSLYTIKKNFQVEETASCPFVGRKRTPPDPFPPLPDVPVSAPGAGFFDPHDPENAGKNGKKSVSRLKNPSHVLF